MIISEKKELNLFFSSSSHPDRLGNKKDMLSRATEQILEKALKIDSQVFLEYVMQKGGE